MGYAKIYNLYQDQRILSFAECFAMEKVHGTSAHVRLRDGNQLQFFSGGVNMAPFQALFDHADLLARLNEVANELNVLDLTVFGEAFGGKCQGYSHTYGPNLRFVAFDVEIGNASEDQRRTFLSVPEAEAIVKRLGLRFVRYARIPTDMQRINEERDRFSTEAELVGIEGKHAEGVILRPVQEVRDARGNRVCAKHKRPEFTETKTVRTVEQSVERLDAKLKDDALATEWVTDMRMVHVLDKLKAQGLSLTPKDTGAVIAAMEADVMAESAGSGAEWSHTALRSLRSITVRMFQKHMPKVTL